jgi:cleavage and polyadenylation specificity factor subunit 1
VDKFVSGKTHLVDSFMGEPPRDLTKGMNEEVAGAGRKEVSKHEDCRFGYAEMV